MINNTKGQAAILIVFVLGMVSLLIGISLTQTGFIESIMGRNTNASGKAFYAANSGIEDAIMQVSLNQTLGTSSPYNYTLSLNESTTDVNVTGSNNDKIITATGTYQNYVRKITAEVQNTSIKPGFDNAVLAGSNGFELRNNTLISGKGGVDGNVFSNSFVKGAKNDFTNSTGVCKSSSSQIAGNVWAVSNLDKLASSDSGVCVMKNAFAGQALFCSVKGNVNATNNASANCPVKGIYTKVTITPTPILLPDMSLINLKKILDNHGTQWGTDLVPKNCIADGSGGSADCTLGTKILGNIEIHGILTKPSNINLKISGPVWVTKDLNLNSNGSVISTITTNSQIIVTEGVLTSSSNVSYGANGNSFLLFISIKAPPGSGDYCNSPTISLSSNNNSVLFYSTKGCLLVNANSTFHGAILGEKIRVENNSTVEYDPALQNAIFNLTSTGGWKILSFKEI